MAARGRGPGTPVEAGVCEPAHMLIACFSTREPPSSQLLIELVFLFSLRVGVWVELPRRKISRGSEVLPFFPSLSNLLILPGLVQMAAPPQNPPL